MQLTSEQKEKIKTVNAKAWKLEREVFDEPLPDLANREERRKKLDERAQKSADIRKQAMENVLDVLEDKQKKAWREFIGEPFEVKGRLDTPAPPT